MLSPNLLFRLGFTHYINIELCFNGFNIGCLKEFRKIKFLMFIKISNNHDMYMIVLFFATLFTAYRVQKWNLPLTKS